MADSESVQDKRGKTWHKNAASQIVLDSIFAAFGGVWITVALSDSRGLIKTLDVAFALLSFFLFAVSAEGTVTSYEEDDVFKFVYYFALVQHRRHSLSQRHRAGRGG